ncbi:MAG: Clp protease ClpP [Verrucomicrobiae bacterium]|nr:Clp protease ClpP [Verrucomicrobiae bacterium]
MKKKWFEIVGLESGPVEIFLRGVIFSELEKEEVSEPGVFSRDFIAALEQIPPEKEILLHIDSPGGAFYDGVEIAQALGKRGNVTCIVDGDCSSTATIIAIACRKVQAYENSRFLIHEARAGETLEGLKSETIRTLANVIDDATKIMVECYIAKTGKTEEEIFEKMSTEAPMTAREALAFGLIDEILTVKIQGKEHMKVNEPAAKTAAENDPLKQRVAAQTPPDGNAAELGAQKIVEAKLKIQNLEAKLEEVRLERITSLVNKACSDGKITNSDIAGWVQDCMANESVVKRLEALPAIKQAPVKLAPDDGKIYAGSDSLNDIATHCKQISGCEKARYIRDNEDKILAALKAESSYALSQRSKGFIVKGAITVDPNLKLDYIHNKIIQEFNRKNGRVDKICTTRFDAMPMRQGSNKVLFTGIPVATGSVETWNGTYVTSGSAETTSIEVEVNKREYVVLSTTSADLVEQPYLHQEKHLMNKVRMLSDNIWDSVMALIVAGNFPNESTAGKVASNAIDHTKICDIAAECDALKWPDDSRCLVLNSLYNATLVKDSVFVNAALIGGESSIRRNNVGGSYGFGYYETNPNIPHNDENLYGFCCLDGGDAILMPSAPIAPPAEAMKTIDFNIAASPDGGMPLAFRSWFDPKTDSIIYIVEARYGLAKGNTAALLRLVTS